MSASARRGREPVAASMLKACLLALLALVVVWAFVSYLQPAFTGERAAELLRCN